jgi:uncharacterized membrane protein
MSPQEWLGLALRWVHLIAGIAWIGSSFYFIWLDAHLEPADPARVDADLEGSLWMVHSGGFYRVERRKIGPARMPAILHWFKWEAFFTGLTGVLLLVLVYYSTHGIYLTDPAVSAIRPGQAALLGASLLVVGWFVYDALWQTLGARSPRAALVVSLALLVALTFGLTRVFSGRGAFMHVGALLGILMVVNVWVRILPAQAAMIRATKEGRTPDFSLSGKAKLRSVHNSYMTFPVLFVMISNHFPGTYGSASPALVLLLLAALGMSARHLMIGKSQRRWWLAVPMIAVAAWLSVLVAPARLEAAGGETPAGGPAAALAEGPAPSYAAVQAVVLARCIACHSNAPRVPAFGAAPGGVNFEKPGVLHRYAERIRIRVVETRTMPLGNMTGMTEDERALLARWVAHGAPDS